MMEKSGGGGPKGRKAEIKAPRVEGEMESAESHGFVLGGEGIRRTNEA